MTKPVVQHAKEPPVRTHCDFAYVVQGDMIEATVKVGRSISPVFRVRGIQSTVPFNLHTVAIMSDGARREREMKDLMQPHQVKGEWYRPHEKLNDYIAKTFEDGGLLAKMVVDAEYVDCFIKPIVLQYLGDRQPMVATSSIVSCAKAFRS